MRVPTVQTMVSAVLGLAAATPTPANAAYAPKGSYGHYPLNTINATTTSSNITNLTGEYYLVTEVIGDESHDKNGLYVSGYHTGIFPPVTTLSLQPALFFHRRSHSHAKHYYAMLQATQKPETDEPSI